MAETAVVDTSVVAAPVITVQETAPVVNQETAPEVDLLTKVSQFKSPVVEDKIVNAPEQPEFAKITDPVAREAAKEAVERMRRGMQSDYTKKVEDAQRLVNQSKSWTPQRIQQELLTNSEFLQAAQMIQGTQTNNNTITQEEYSALTESEKKSFNEIPQLRNELQQMKNQNLQEQLLSSINQKDLTLRGKFADYDPQKINEAAQRFGKLTPADAREYIYKADNFETAVKNAYQMGKLEGQGKLQTKINAIAPQGSAITSNEGVPTKVAGESDKAFFVRLGNFRLAQFKNQK